MGSLSISLGVFIKVVAVEFILHNRINNANKARGRPHNNK
jgi:hypothetical protein